MKIIIKIGTSTLTYVSGCINIRRIESLCKVISDLKNAGNEVIMVSSGAIAMGHGKLNIKNPPQNIAEKQAFAAVGQCELMYAYDKIFPNTTIPLRRYCLPPMICATRSVTKSLTAQWSSFLNGM